MAIIITDEINPNLLVETMFQPALPPRKSVDHKGSFGSVAIIGGDTSMVGAALLAARAALLSGAGRVYASLLTNESLGVDFFQPEIMLRPPHVLTELTQLNCVVIGPGLGQSVAAIELLELWLVQNVPILLDADALNLLAKHEHLVNLTKNRHAGTIITPHVGEAARLLAIDIDIIQKNRTESALKLAKLINVVCVLKGAGSVCADPEGNWFINTSGNPGLASGGTGDVLSGVIGSLIAQGLSCLGAAKLGVYVHGAAADALVNRGIGPVGLTASEVAYEIRNVINRCNESGS